MNAAIRSDSSVDIYEIVSWLQRYAKPEFQLIVCLEPEQIVRRIEENFTARRSDPKSSLFPYGRFDARNLKLYHYISGIYPFSHDPPPLRISFEQYATTTTVIGTLDRSDDTILPPLSTMAAFAGVFVMTTAIYADPRMMLEFIGISLCMGMLYSIVQQVRRVSHLSSYRRFLEALLADSHDGHRGTRR